jgi:pimeloyl-ACP methyl ester carboxylesterase
MADISTVMLDTSNGVHRVRLAGLGPPLLVIPGMPGIGATYLVEDVTALLGESHRLVFIDQRGAGKSPVGQRPLTIEAYVEDVAAVADALAIEEFNIMGHSFGGLQTTYVAAAYPDRIRRIILLDSAAPTRELSHSAFAPGTAIHRRTRTEDTEEKASITASPNWMHDQKKLDRWLILEFRAFYSDPTTSATLPHDIDGDMYHQWRITEKAVGKSLGNWDITPLLPSIQAPVLLINCRESILGTDIPHVYEDLLPNVQLVWVKGGHTPPTEDPTAFASAVEAFFNSETGHSN